MDEKELQELESPANWDYDSAEKKPGVKKPRAVVSVSFSRGDFEQVAEYAEGVGMKTSEFIRRAALDRVRPQDRISVAFSIGGSGIGSTTFVNKSSPTTRPFNARMPEPSREAVATTT